MEQLTMMDGVATLPSPNGAPHAQHTEEEMPTMASKDQERDRERLIDVLQRELEAARAREQMVLDHATSVVRLFEQASKRLESVEQHIQALDQRLQPLPQGRERETPPALSARALLHGKSRGALRYTILGILEGHPEGMTRKQIETAVGTGKNLSDTIGHMKRDQLIISKKLGVYVLANASDAPEA
jgi:hypothetical protein